MVINLQGINQKDARGSNEHTALYDIIGLLNYNYEQHIFITVYITAVIDKS